jgi:hypothetical protein
MNSRFTYSVVRYVPCIARGEFVNAAIVVGSDVSGEYELVTASVTNTTARNLGGAANTLNRFLRPIQSLVDDMAFVAIGMKDAKEASLSESKLRRMSEDHRSSIQFSPPQPVLAESLQEAVEQLSGIYFRQPDSRAKPEITKSKMSATLRRALSSQQLVKLRDYGETVSVNANGHKSKIDFVVSNGAPKVLVQEFSFYKSDQEALLNEIRSWGFFLERVRDGGATMPKIASEGDFVIDKDIMTFALCAVPDEQSSELRDTVAEAQSVFAIARVEKAQLNQVDQLAKTAKQLVDHAS